MGTAVRRIPPSPGTRTVRGGSGTGVGGRVPACQLRVLDACVEGVLGGRKHEDGVPFTFWFGHFPAGGT